MTKTEINAAIVAEARAKIKDLGLQGKLDIFPVENSFTRRPRYWMKQSCSPRSHRNIQIRLLVK